MNTLAVLDRIETKLAGWLPSGAAICSAGAGLDFPIPERERKSIARATRARQAEFIAGRWCAHGALRKAGYPADSIPASRYGAPIWPRGVTGSITHESGICLAAVVATASKDAIGIDLFDMRRDVDMDDIAGFILGREETDFWRAGANGASYLQLAFSAKEATVKAVSSKLGRFLDIREIRLVVESGTFHARLDDFPDRICGNWAIVGPFLLTFAALESRLCPSQPSIPKTCGEHHALRSKPADRLDSID